MTPVNLFPPPNGGARFSALCPAIPGITFEGEPVKRRTRGMLAVAAASVTVVSGVAFAPAAIAAPADDSTPAAAQRLDNRPGPLTERQNERRKAAQKLILSGQASPGEDGVVQLADDKYYEASVTGTGRLFTILSEFGDQASGKLGSTPGPLHNEIPEPDRAVNNSTHWMADFDTESYEELFFGAGESFADFYTKQSSGAYTVAGEVSDWVKVPGNASTYGDNAVEDFGGSWQFIEDTGNAWYDAQVAADKTVDEIKAELASFDVWDRYDADGDGDFDEPDGYLDHFQAVHAGEGEDAGGGAQGEDAIWSHRWYVNSTDYGTTGPEGAKFGGAQIGEHRLSGSATTRSRPRTAASACSRTSTRTTSACPTSTTRPAARTAPASGRSCRAARGSTRARTTSARPRTTWVRGRSSSSAGSTTRS